jgi:phage terminase large subunit-like protein
MNLAERLMKYVNDILDGTIPACQKHIWACQRFIRDLERIQNDKDCPFYFDIDQLYDFYEWAKQFKHFKGVLARQHIELTDFQLFIGANIFCFLNKKNDKRRFLRVFIELARKNAKSQFLALIASYITFLSEQQEECYIAGWDRQQSSLVYNDILNQLGACEILEGKYKDAYGKITHHRSGSIIVPLSKEAKKTGDGTNPSLGIVDEYHAHDTSEIYDVIDSGMGARENTLMFIITTAGFNINGPCYKEYKYCSQVLDPDNPVNNDEYFVIICELDEKDDIKDESVWIKANPIVATYEAGIKKLQSDLKIALDNPEKMRSFLTKRMNRWVDQKPNGYMNMAKWSDCGREIDWEEFRGQEVYIGVDLSAKIDLTSVNFETKKGEKYLIKNHSFMPEDTLAIRARTDRAHYQLWAENEKWITATPGAVVDYSFIKKYIKEKEEQYDLKIREICADPWNATQFMQDMENEGYVVVEIRQGIATLGGATKDFREQVYQGNVEHDESPVLTFAMANAVTRIDANENIMLDKSKSTERIDPAAATINSHVRTMLLNTNVDINKVTEDYLKMMGW